MQCSFIEEKWDCPHGVAVSFFDRNKKRYKSST